MDTLPGQLIITLQHSSLLPYRELMRSHHYAIKIDVPSSYGDRDMEELVGMLLVPTPCINRSLSSERLNVDPF